MYSTNSPGFITRRGRFIEIWGLEKLKKMNANFSEVNDLTIDQHEEMLADEKVDLLYLPGCSVKKGDPGRDEFLKKMAEYYFTLEGLSKIKKKTGRT